MIFQTEDFIFSHPSGELPEHFETTEEAPSNIAIVKYWGKKGLQIPMNTSVSFTLTNSKTITTARAEKLNQPQNEVLFSFLFEGKENPAFNEKLKTFLNRIQRFSPYINQYKWHFESRNTFPHSSGIASSASGFAALAKIIMKLEQKINPRKSWDYQLAKTSFLARLGSGSASRSVTGPVMIWGKHHQIKESSDEYAIVWNDLHENFKHVSDWIILIETGVKQVSSTTGHQLMQNHPFKTERITLAQQRSIETLKALKTGDWELFGKILEEEALMLHAMMMTSSPYYLLMKPETLKIIQSLWDYRKHTSIPSYFSLDAGANVHLIFPASYNNQIKDWLESDLKSDKNFISDYISS